MSRLCGMQWVHRDELHRVRALEGVCVCVCVCVCVQVEVGDRHRPAFTIQCESAMVE